MKPEERSKKIESYGGAYQRLLAALEKFPREMWQFRPTPDRWTIHEIIVHITDSEANSYVRCRRFLAEPGETILGYDENRWAVELDYQNQDPNNAIELFRWLRNNTYSLIKAMPESVWSNSVYHSESGKMSMDDWLTTYERHIHDHIEQMQENYADWYIRRDED